MSTLSTVKEIKASLSKMLPVDSISEESQLEQCRDMFKQLADCAITLDILTTTLIGTVVSKFKSHEELGPEVKLLVKQWKIVAKEAPKASKNAPPASAAAPRKKAAPQAERRGSTASGASADTAANEEEWLGLQPARQNTCKKLHQFLLGAKSDLVKDGINADAISHLAVSRATEIEAAIQKKHGSDKQAYAGKARSLCFNIKKNVKLGGQIILGQITAKDLVRMSSDELASDDQRKEMAERTKSIMDSTRLDWDQANESKINDMCGIKGDLLNASLFTCGRCKSHKTTSTQKQTRSADEPMTVFVLCLNCGKRWKC
jgi:transcription elongation factor S-II